MVTPRVLLDTNIIVSGLVFKSGNEHKILRLVEDEDISLVLPEPILLEAREILQTKFGEFEGLFEVFLENIKFESLTLDRILPASSQYSDYVRDEKDLAIFASVALARPSYFVTGDKNLKIDLLKHADISRVVKICSSREFLSDLRKHRGS